MVLAGLVRFESGLRWSGSVSAGQNGFETLWSVLSRSKPVCAGAVLFESGLSWSNSVCAALVLFEPVKTGMSRSTRV